MKHLIEYVTSRGLSEVVYKKNTEGKWGKPENTSIFLSGLKSIVKSLFKRK